MSTENPLNIKITSDVTDAVTAFNQLIQITGNLETKINSVVTSATSLDKAITSTSRRLNTLMKNLGESTNAVKAFQKMATGKKADLFGIAALNSNLNKVKTKADTLKRSFDSVGAGFDKKVTNSLSKIDSTIANFKKNPIKLKITADTKGVTQAINKSLKNAGVEQIETSKQKGGGSSSSPSANRSLSQYAQAAERFLFDGFLATHANQIASRTFGEIAHLQEKRARVSAWNLNAQQKRIWNQQVQQLLADNKLITEADAESMMLAAASSIGHYDPKIVGGTVARATKYAQMEKAMGYNKSEIDDIAKNYYGVAEARQVANDIEKTLKTFETVFRITTTSSGKITVADVETILRNVGPGAATLTEEGLLRLLAYAEQIKVAGRGQSGSTGAGISTVGTTTKMLQLMAMGKPSSIGAKKMFAELGVFDDSVYELLDNGDVRLVLEGEGSAEGKAERDAARQIFEAGALKRVQLERGEYGQVLGDVIIRDNLARAGAYDKRLAQEDPVRWVQSLIPLIKQFTSDIKHRGDYYSDILAQRPELANLSTEEFMSHLNESDFLSAITSFWARTGLSQRVINAFSIFSNEAFQHRSAAMLKTAQNQKDVDSLMNELIEGGNLNLAFLRFEKALNRAIQAFEPFGTVFAKLTYYASDFLESFGEWAKNFEYLATASASWFAARLAQGVAIQAFRGYDHLFKARDSADDMTSGVASGMIAANSSAGGKKGKKSTTKDVKNAQVEAGKGFIVSLNQNFNKVKGMISKLASFATKAFSAIGWALLAVDITSVFMNWFLESTKVGQKIESWWTAMINRLSKTPLVMSVIYDTDDNRTNEQKAQIAKLKAERDSLRDSLAGSYSDETADGLSIEGYQNRAELQKRLSEVEAELKTIETYYSRAMMSSESVGYQLKSQFNAPDLQSLRDQIAKAEESLVFETQKLQQMNKMGGVNKDNADLFDNQIMAVNEAQRKRDEVVEKYEKALGAERLVKIYTEIEKILNEVKDDEKVGAIVRQFFVDIINNAVGYDAASETGLKIASKNGNLSIMSMLLAGAKGPQYVANEQAATEAVRETRKSSADADVELKNSKRLPNTYESPRMSAVKAYEADLNERLRKATAASTQKFGFDSDAELMDRARSMVITDLQSGNLNEQFQISKFYRQDRKATQDRGGYLTPEDLDWNKEVDGVRLSDFANKRAQLLRLEKYNSSFSSLAYNAESALLDSVRNLEQAQQSTTKVGEAGLLDSGYRSAVQELNRLIEQLAASGVKSPVQGVALDNRRQAILNQTYATALGREREYADATEQFNLDRMTSKEQEVYNLDQEIEMENAKHQATLKAMELAYNDWVKNNQSASNEELLAAQQEYNTRVENLELGHTKRREQLERDRAEAIQHINLNSIRQKQEDWQDIEAFGKNFSDQFMQGFITANESWLDGDENAWSDYFDSLLKMWRKTVLQMGYSKLLGSTAEYATSGLSSFIMGALGREMPAKTDAKGKSAEPNSVDNAMHNAGSSIFGWLFGDSEEGGGVFDKITTGLKNAFSESVDWLGSLFDNFDFSGFFDSFLSVFSSIDFGGLFDSLGGILDGAGNWISGIVGSLFANGGVMTSQGPLPLRMYSNGGIAKHAQVAVFGEGSMPEAYVPLPDGRSIPVTMTGNATQAGGNQISISINVTNNAGNTSESTSSTSNANDNMRQLANNLKNMVKQEIVNQSRPGGLLYNAR